MRGVEVTKPLVHLDAVVRSGNGGKHVLLIREVLVAHSPNGMTWKAKVPYFVRNAVLVQCWSSFEK